MPSKCKFFWTEKGCRNGDNCPFSHEIDTNINEDIDKDNEFEEEIKLWYLFNYDTCKKAKAYSRNLKNKKNNNINFVSVTNNICYMSGEEYIENQEFALEKNDLSNIDPEEVFEYKYVLISGKNEESVKKCVNEILKTNLPESYYDSDSDIDYARIRNESGEVSEYGKSKGILYVI